MQSLEAKMIRGHWNST